MLIKSFIINSNDKEYSLIASFISNTFPSNLSSFKLNASKETNGEQIVFNSLALKNLQFLETTESSIQIFKYSHCTILNYIYQ